MTSRSAAHVEDTRRALIAAARDLFTAVGFQATLTEEIVRKAGLTRGALYHHFRDKEDLFAAVFAEVADEVERSLIRRSTSPDPVGAWDLFLVNSEVHLEAASKNAAYRQIVLIDGPSVLGRDAWSASRSGPVAKIAEYLTDAIGEGVLEPLPAEAMAHLLGAIGTGAVMYVAQAEDRARARRDIEICNDRLLSGLAHSIAITNAALSPTAARRSTSNANHTTRQGGH